jgi:hypothetical protein
MRKLLFVGSICFDGFETLGDIEYWMGAKMPVEVDFYLNLPAGIESNGAVVIRKKEKP